MPTVLDSNELIFALREKRREQLIILSTLRDICIPTIILEEVLRNLNVKKRTRERIKATLTKNLTIIDAADVPKELVKKYCAKGLKPADALIAAFAEWIGAETLITENRHFLKNVKIKEFRVTTACDFLEKYAGRYS